MLFRSDRKSTRLNSSHLVISYAVFCLKKKNKKTSNIHTRQQKTYKENATHCHRTSDDCCLLRGLLISARVSFYCCVFFFFFFFKWPAPPKIFPFPPPRPSPV